ncbi:glutamine cyclotransferase [Nitzschia inconspicua]|uniref:Glutamine cyclotransferase n=1 Tax=Nitzschia inconspicua TaxID=303405 RepID=A0A9K3LJI3_9STRA|nr:glutamine cyclotransferase [Nitzschia inconspicua]
MAKKRSLRLRGDKLSTTDDDTHDAKRNTAIGTTNLRQRRKGRQLHGTDNSINDDDDEDEEVFLSFQNENQKQNARSRSIRKMLGIAGVVIMMFTVLAVVLVGVSHRDTDVLQKKSTNGDHQSTRQNDQFSSKLAVDDTTSTVVATITQEYQLLGTYQHDKTSFTQGLTVAVPSDLQINDYSNQSKELLSSPLLLVESTGIYKQSYVRVWDPETQQVHREVALDDQYFGEGMTDFTLATSSYYMVLTYREGKVLIYDTTTLRLVQSIDSPSTTTGEAWGITYREDADNLHDGVPLFYVTDGSHYLLVWKLNYHFDDQNNVPFFSLQEIQRIPISLSLQRPGDGTIVHRDQVQRLNELEYDTVTKTILANVWFEPVVLRIDPNLGRVTQIYDLSPLAEPMKEAAARDMNIVMNGIALIPNTTILQNGRLRQQDFYVTGKYWEELYKIRIFE